jgi:hypothetical protein
VSAHTGSSDTVDETLPVVDEAILDLPAEDSRLSVTLAEALLLAAATVVGLVALVSLASAQLHHHTLPIVAVGSVLLVAAAVAVVVVFDRPRLRLDLVGLAPILVGLAYTAVMVFPGFEYGSGDRDPGAYVEHAVAISRTHSIDFTDDLVAAHLTGPTWPALWSEPGHPGKILPQFYHLWPALLATAKDTGGFTGLFNTGPLLAVIAVGLAVAVARRLAGIPAAWAVAVLLSTNMLEVWQAKYPTAEIFGQMLFLGAVLGVVLAIQSRWRAASAIGGVLLGLSYLERPDAIVLILFGWAALAALLAARRFDQQAAWFAVGLVALLPYGFFQAYHLAKTYTLAVKVPSLAKVLAAMVGLAVIGAVFAWQRRFVAGLIAWAEPARKRFLLGTVFVGVCGALMLLGGLRPILFGKDYFFAHGRHQRSFDEISLIRLSWFFSLPGLGLMLVGFGYVAWRRWHLDRWLVALPAAGLLLLYCYHLRNSPYMMWSTRRFVTTVVPGMVLLMGFGAALIFLLLRRYVNVLIASGAVAAVAQPQRERRLDRDREADRCGCRRSPRGVPVGAIDVLLRRAVPALRRTHVRDRRPVERIAAERRDQGECVRGEVRRVLQGFRTARVLHRRSDQPRAGGAGRDQHEGSAAGRGATALAGDVYLAAEEAQGLPVRHDRVPADRELTALAAELPDGLPWYRARGAGR